MKLPAFIFSNKLLYRFLRHFAFWAGISLFAFSFMLNEGYSPAINIFDTFKSIIQFIPFILSTEIPYCYLVVYAVVPRYFLSKKYKVFLLYLFLINLIFLIHATCHFYYVYVVSLGEEKYSFMWNDTISFFTKGPPAVCITFLSLKFYKTWYLKQEEKQMLIKTNADAEIMLLKAQVHPHFLFNTLNNIYSFVLIKSPQALLLVRNLSDILKYMINDCDAALVPLQKEVKMLQDYIALEKVRYGDRLNIEVTVTGDCADKMITPLLLIPFVENAFKHGSSKMLDKPFIKMNIQIQESTLYFSLVNNKPLADNNNNTKKGIGLTNVKKRLQLLYPGKHSLQIESTRDTFMVEMQIPLHENVLPKEDISLKGMVPVNA